MPTRRSTSIAFSRASARFSPACTRRPSMICQPTLYTGFSTLPGSWNTIAASRPRTSRICLPDNWTTSCALVPSLRDRTTAPRVVAVSGSSPRMLRAVTVLPLPLSPTMASTSPGSTERLTSRTASTVPASVANEIARLSMSTTLIARLRPRSAPRSLALPAMLARASFSRRSLPASQRLEPPQATGRGQRAARHDGHLRQALRLALHRPPAGPQPRVGEVVEALADQGQPEHGQHDRRAGEHRRPPDAAGDVGERFVQVEAPFGARGRLD